MVQGIPQIKIPVKITDLSISAIEPYLESVYSAFTENTQKITAFYGQYLLNQAILGKTRPYDDQSDVNNIVCIPNINSAIEWKTGYILGNPIKYAQSKTQKTDDIEYLNKYVRDVCQRSVDKEVVKWAYATGVGYYFIQPKTTAYDDESESPYEIYCIPSNTCAKVYSSYLGNPELFDLLYSQQTRIDRDNNVKTVDVLDIYLPNTFYTYEKKDDGWVRIREENRQLYRYLPLVEKRPNKDGIGIVAKAQSMQDAIDKLISNGLDNVQDAVNEIYVYRDVSLGDNADEIAENHKAMKKNGAIVLKSTEGKPQADLETITPKLSLKEVTEIYKTVNEAFHATIGVPMEMSGTNSGGTTKQGSEVANGYDNAYNRALDDINTFLDADTKVLKRIIWICLQSPNKKIDNLSASEIEIKYSLNLTDNMLTKSQSYGTFIQTMPPAMALRFCRLSNDPEAEGKTIENSAMYKKFVEEKKENIQINETIE